MTPAPHDSQTGGLVSHEALVQRETSPAMTASPACYRTGRWRVNRA